LKKSLSVSQLGVDIHTTVHVSVSAMSVLSGCLVVITLIIGAVLVL
jgi:hypothetical protein